MEVSENADALLQPNKDVCQQKNDDCITKHTENVSPACATTSDDSINNEHVENAKEQLCEMGAEKIAQQNILIVDSDIVKEERELNINQSSSNNPTEQTSDIMTEKMEDSSCTNINIQESNSISSSEKEYTEKEDISNVSLEHDMSEKCITKSTENIIKSEDDVIQEPTNVELISLEQAQKHSDQVTNKSISESLDPADGEDNIVSNTEDTDTNINLDATNFPKEAHECATDKPSSSDNLEVQVDTNDTSTISAPLEAANDSITSKNLNITADKVDTNSTTSDLILTKDMLAGDENIKIGEAAEVQNSSETSIPEKTVLQKEDISNVNSTVIDSKLHQKSDTCDKLVETANKKHVHVLNNTISNEVCEIPDNIIGSSDKDVSGKIIVEPENTEFVQFSQDRHEDSQIEGQSIDAEDPFGGDNLPSENIEPMETDEDVGFSKLSKQTNNVQDSISVEVGELSERHNINDSLRPISVINNLAPSQKSFENEISESQNCNDVSGNSKQMQTVITSLAEQTESSDGMKNNDTTKNVGDTIEGEQPQSEILPGQDDELCIIPDSMKLVIPETGKDEVDPKNIQLLINTRDGKNTSEKECQNGSKPTCKDTHAVTDTGSKKVLDNAQNTEEKGLLSDTNKDKRTDIINIDEDSKNSEVEEIATKEICKQCKEETSCKIKVKIGAEMYNVCSKTCKVLFNIANNKAMDIPSDGVNSKHEKRCASCLLIIEANDEKNLSWETMEFCNETCLGKFQTKYGSYCRNCNGTVQAVSLGKYCVRFGYDVRQFCCSSCLEEFKKGLKVCSYCQKDISSCTEGFLAPVGDKGQFKDFCTQDCMEKYTKMSSAEPAPIQKKYCSVCQKEKVVYCEVQLEKPNPIAICSEPCLAAFKFVNKVDPDQCSTCKKFFQLPNKRAFVVFYENEARTFCTKTCLNVFIITNRKIVPCSWCKVKKYNFDMIKKELKSGQVMMMCSLNCLTLYQVSINAVSAKRINCDLCKEFSQAQYHLTMSDATIRNFCSYNCVMNFQAQYTKSPITIPSGDDPVPTGMPKRTLPLRNVASVPPKTNEVQNKKNMPVISSVTSLAEIGNGRASPKLQQNNMNNIVVSTNTVMQNQSPQVIYKQQIITRPPSPTKVHNKMTQCKPVVHTKGVSVRPHPCTKSTQTEEVQQVLIPIPVPIYVPFPVHMYSMPYPVPVPFPLPIPVPIFIPTTKNSAKAIFKDIKRIQEKIPADPFEAELLMMAEMVATEKKANESDSDSGDDRDDTEVVNDNSRDFSPEVDSGNTFGEDMLQMALKMATGELDEPAVDLEAALTPNTITASQAPSQSEASIENEGIEIQSERLVAASRGRKRMAPYKARATPNKRGRRVSGTHEIPLMPPPEPQPPPQPRVMEPIEKPDANMALKYTFGVNAWRQWVIAKNSELEKQNTPTRRIKLFKTDLLQLTADELNYSLCLFVKEVRKPNGTEYAPDTIYYLCLGIQQYLFENNRIDNIFTDSYYEKFTDCLNEVAKKFSILYNDAQYIVTRVEEEHLWECKQLGAHSPHVLLSTLMFFNTKHFNLITVEEHMQLSFSHIMKHWKRNPATQPASAAGKVPGSRNVLLRFYPPQSALEGNSRKKKVYEQQENEENPLRCPVKLYEFYLSKCPESVKTRNDVFYLLPERSCVPDSPVWYSTSPLAKEHLIKMLYRIKMVKEINVALLTS